jgi:hypothetical protein
MAINHASCHSHAHNCIFISITALVDTDKFIPLSLQITPWGNTYRIRLRNSGILASLGSLQSLRLSQTFVVPQDCAWSQGQVHSKCDLDNIHALRRVQKRWPPTRSVPPRSPRVVLGSCSPLPSSTDMSIEIENRDLVPWPPNSADKKQSSPSTHPTFVCSPLLSGLLRQTPGIKTDGTHKAKADWKRGHQKKIAVDLDRPSFPKKEAWSVEYLLCRAAPKSLAQVFLL